MLLSALAHNVIVWTQRWLVGLTPKLGGLTPKLGGYGLLRLVRDVFTTSGFVQTNAEGQVDQIVLNGHDPLVKGLVDALRGLFQMEHILVNSGET